ncbi:hypothetical protein FOZ63_006664, partial [Perkinsus olseni]
WILLHKFDARSLVNTEAEVVLVINESLSYLPRSEDLDGLLPSIRPVDQNAFDSLTPPSIGLVLVILAGRGLGHFGPRSGDMEYLTSAPFAVPREDVLPGDWGEFWQGFDDGHGCNGFLNDAFVVFEHPLVAANSSLVKLGEGPQRNKDSREEAWPENPEIVTEAG